MDIEGNTIIPPRFHDGYGFHEGLAYVERRPGRGGYIDINGRFVIGPRNSIIGSEFENGMAAFVIPGRDGGREGVIDTRGRWIVRPQYDSCVYNDRHNIWELKYQGVDSEGFETIITDLFFPDLGKTVNGYETVDILSPTKFTGWQGEKAYFVDVYADKAVRYEFDDIGSLSEALIAVRRGELFGYIDINGNLILDFQFDLAQPFSEGLAAVNITANGDT